MKNQTLAITCLSLGIVLGGHELVASSSVVETETHINKKTGDVLVSSQKRGFNPIMVLAALTGVCMGVSSLDDDRKTLVAQTPRSSATTSKPEYAIAPKTAIQAQTTRQSQKQTFELIKAIYLSYKPHVLVTCETGTGKTFLLLGLIKYVWEATHGQAEFYISTVKEGNFFGLQKLKDAEGIPRVVVMPKLDLDGSLGIAARRIIRQLDVAMSSLDDRAKHSMAELEAGRKPPKYAPLYCILDEYPTTLSLLEKAANKDNNYADLISQISGRVAAIARVGREHNARVVILGQGYQVNTVGLDTDLQLNFVHLILGRYYGDQGQDIWACSIAKKAFGVSGNGKSLFGKKEGVDYWEEFSRLMKANKGRPVVWSDIKNGSVLMPNLSGIDREKINWTGNQLTQDKDPWGAIETNATAA